MSWAVEEWKDGLPGKALQKIQEMEVQLDKMKKEKTQKQFQLDSLEAAIQKQKQKVNIYHKSCWLFLTVIILL
uniref:Centromere protein Cenp-F N-terminal domain-containing protein n=1 Tax=Oreochromis aureus TaxID=47969 RepID=A0AAZ1WYY3_OREAU